MMSRLGHCGLEESFECLTARATALIALAVGCWPRLASLPPRAKRTTGRTSWMMKLLYTPRSHFSRKVRILLDAWREPVELVDAGNVADNVVSAFGGSPLMTVPALVDEGALVLDSDHIAQYLVRKRGGPDELEVLTTDRGVLNVRSVLNGIMAAEVEVILAERTGIDVAAHRRFQKKLDVIRGGLDWLEARAQVFSGEPSYVGFHLVAMWDHLVLYRLVEPAHPALGAHVTRLSALHFVAKSAPR